jgi:hypothetical protein
VSLVLSVCVVLERLTQGSNTRQGGVVASRTDGANRITYYMGFATGRGTVTFDCSCMCNEKTKPPPTTHFGFFRYGSYGPIPANWGQSVPGFAGFGAEITTNRRSANYTGIWEVMRLLMVPAWFLATAMALPPVVLIWRWNRSRVHAGCCRICGYDLRATPDRCPECGTIPPPKKEIATT